MAFDPSAFAAPLADLSVAGARTPTGTDHAANFATAGTDFLSTADDAVRIDPVNGWTCCFWLKGSGTFAASCEGDSSGGWRLDFGAGGGRFLVFSSSGGLIGNVDVGLAPPASTEWAFFALQVDPAAGNKYRIRKNRGAWAEGTLSGSPHPGTADTRIGVYSPGSGFAGSFASVLFSRQVLSEAEIDEAFGMPGGASYAGFSTGLKVKVAEFWGMAESSGPRVGSKSGIALAVNGTVARVAGPATAAPTATGDPIEWWLSGPGARADVQATGAARPTYVAAADSPTGRPAIRFPDDAAIRMTAPTAVDLRSHAIAVVGRSLHRDGINDVVQFGSTGSGYYSGIGDFGARPQAVGSGVVLGYPAAIAEDHFRTRDADIRVFSGGASGTIFRNNDAAGLTGAALTAGTAAGLSVGASPTHPAAEDVERLIAWGSPATSPEVAAIVAGLRADHPRPIPSATLPVVLFAGNSIHYGVSASAVAATIPSLAMASLGLPYGSRWLEMAIPGQSTPECTANDPAKVAAYRVDSRARTIVACTEGTNSIFLYGHDAATAFQEEKDRIAAMKVAIPGCWNLTTTCLPRDTGNSPARDAYNASLRAAFATPTAYPHVFLGSESWSADCVLADWAAEPTMGPDDANADEAHYDAAHIHPIDAGAALLAPISADALRVAGALYVPPVILARRGRSYRSGSRGVI